MLMYGQYKAHQKEVGTAIDGGTKSILHTVQSQTVAHIGQQHLLPGLACLFHKGIQKGSKFEISPVYCFRIWQAFLRNKNRLQLDDFKKRFGDKLRTIEKCCTSALVLELVNFKLLSTLLRSKLIFYLFSKSKDPRQIHNTNSPLKLCTPIKKLDWGTIQSNSLQNM